MEPISTNPGHSQARDIAQEATEDAPKTEPDMPTNMGILRQSISMTTYAIGTLFEKSISLAQYVIPGMHRETHMPYSEKQSIVRVGISGDDKQKDLEQSVATEKRKRLSKSIVRDMEKLHNKGIWHGLRLISPRISAHTDQNGNRSLIDLSNTLHGHISLSKENCLQIGRSTTFSDGQLASAAHFVRACLNHVKAPWWPHSEAHVMSFLSPFMLEWPQRMNVIVGDTIQHPFSSIDSSTLTPIPVALCQDLSSVADPVSLFLSHEKQSDELTHPPVIIHSEIIPVWFVVYQMRYNETPSGVEALFRQFITPVVSGHVAADTHGRWASRRFHGDRGRAVVIDASERPCRAIYAFTQAIDVPRTGRPLPYDFSIPKSDTRHDTTVQAAYDAKLAAHLVYHLLTEHMLPAIKDIAEDDICSVEEAICFAGALIADADKKNMLRAVKGRFVLIQGHICSLEMLLNFFVLRLRNAFGAFEALLPQGYVYTVDPIGYAPTPLEAVLLGRMECLAFTWMRERSALFGLRIIACSEESDDHDLLWLWQQAASTKQTVQVMPRRMPPVYDIDRPYALIICGLDAANDGFSTAACSLRRDRKDLCHFLFSDI